MSLDIKKIRADTPGVADVVHLAAAGSGLMPQPVIDAIILFLMYRLMLELDPQMRNMLLFIDLHAPI